MTDSAPASVLADDVLHGAAEIAEFLYGDRQQRRKVYHLAETSRLPVFRYGARLKARRSTLLSWIADQERRGWRGGALIPPKPSPGAVVARSPKKASDDGGGGGIHPLVSQSEAAENKVVQKVQAMWIFGYGSLMFDGWEREHGCACRAWADLRGYRRDFNKKSVRNWGSQESPGVTLNVVPADNAVCRGVAFQCEDGSRNAALLEYLREREGCDPRELPVRLEGGEEIQALVYVYTGRNLLPAGTTLQQKVWMVIKATGESGANRDYVRRTFENLEKIGIRDPAVTELWDAVRQVR